MLVETISNTRTPPHIASNNTGVHRTQVVVTTPGTDNAIASTVDVTPVARINPVVMINTGSPAATIQLARSPRNTTPTATTQTANNIQRAARMAGDGSGVTGATSRASCAINRS